MTVGREEFLRRLVRQLADTRLLEREREKRLRLAIENDRLDDREVRELVIRSTPGQPHRRACLEDFLHPQEHVGGGGPTPEPDSAAGATAETPSSQDIARVAPPSDVDQPASCTCIRGIVNGHLPHFAECELASRIAHNAGPRRPSDDFDGAIQ